MRPEEERSMSAMDIFAVCGVVGSVSIAVAWFGIENFVLKFSERSPKSKK